ncbi:MAG: DUF2400 domain-containing protein [Bacteroidales bacterium]|nr:DUF2400 domain-containing protein [Bacteroidales bacterium]
MLSDALRSKLIKWAETYNDPRYFTQDPIIFPKAFASSKKDAEVSAVLSAHLAWGRRASIVNDCNRLFALMNGSPYDYVMRGEYRRGKESAHRTISWDELAGICARLKNFYEGYDSLERLSAPQMRVEIYGQKEDKKAANKKINMLRRWMVRQDGKVDLGLWTDTDPAYLVMPLDVHVYDVASSLGLTSRKAKDIQTAVEITDVMKEIWPSDPLLGDFALFGAGIDNAEL